MLLSKGNTKLGEIPNISLPPILTCKGCEDICGKMCYAQKFYRLRPNVRKQWDANLQHLQEDMEGFFEELYKKLTSKITHKFFRFHTGGDLINAVHFQYILGLAGRLPQINFLIFTKQFSIVNSSVSTQFPVPENLQIVFSCWPGLMVENPHNFPIAYMQDGTETRVPEDAIVCPGLCDTCGMCFQLSKLGRSVIFHKH